MTYVDLEFCFLENLSYKKQLIYPPVCVHFGICENDQVPSADYQMS